MIYDGFVVNPPTTHDAEYNITIDKLTPTTHQFVQDLRISLKLACFVNIKSLKTIEM